MTKRAYITDVNILYTHITWCSFKFVLSLVSQAMDFFSFSRTNFKQTVNYLSCSNLCIWVYKKLSIINSTLGSHLCQRDLNYHQNGSGPLDNETIGNNRFHKSGDLVLTLNMVKSYFSFTSYTDIVQIFQSMFSTDMIANKWPLENRLGSHLCQRDLNYHQNGSGPLDNETITTLSVFYLNL
jgi:hypothetical protein